MKIHSFLHKGLKRLYEQDDTKGVGAASADKLRKMLLFLEAMEDPEELRALAQWKVHSLSGNRAGTWSLSVTGNRRLTFYYDASNHALCELNLEDYH